MGLARNNKRLAETIVSRGETMKKLLTVLLIVIMILSLAACGEDNVSNDNTSASAEETSTSEVPKEKEPLVPTKVIVYEEDEGYVWFDIIVRNETDAEINTITLDLSCLDKDGNIIDSTYPQVPVRVLPGQSLPIDGIVELGEVQTVKLDGYSFYDKNGNYIDGRFDSVDPFMITEVNTFEYAEPKECKDEIDADLSLGGKSDLSIESLSYDGESDGFKEFSAVIKNNGDKTINTLTINYIILDADGNICDATYPQIPNRIDPGQTVKMDALTDNENAVYFTVDGYSYYVGDDTDGEYVDGFFPVIPKAVAFN